MRREGARSNASNASNRSVGAAGVAGAGLPPPLRDSRNSNTTTATTTATSRQTRAQAIQHATAHLATLTNQLQQYQQHQNQQQQQQQQSQQQQPPPTQHEFRLGQDVPPGIERRHVANLRLVCRYDFTNANAAGGAQQLQQQPASIVAEPDIYPVQEGVNVIGSWPEETNSERVGHSFAGLESGQHAHIITAGNLHYIRTVRTDAQVYLGQERRPVVDGIAFELTNGVLLWVGGRCFSYDIITQIVDNSQGNRLPAIPLESILMIPQQRQQQLQQQQQQQRTIERNIEQLPVRLQHEIQQQQIMANFDYLATEDPRALLMRTLGVAPEDMESILNIPQSRKASGNLQQSATATTTATTTTAGRLNTNQQTATAVATATATAVVTATASTVAGNPDTAVTDATSTTTVSTTRATAGATAGELPPDFQCSPTQRISHSHPDGSLGHTLTPPTQRIITPTMHRTATTIAMHTASLNERDMDGIGDMPSRFLDGLPPAASSDQQQQEQEQQQGQGQQQQQQQQQQQHGYRTPTGQQYQHHYQGRTATSVIVADFVSPTQPITQSSAGVGTGAGTAVLLSPTHMRINFGTQPHTQTQTQALDSTQHLPSSDNIMAIGHHHNHHHHPIDGRDLILSPTQYIDFTNTTVHNELDVDSSSNSSSSSNFEDNDEDEPTPLPPGPNDAINDDNGNEDEAEAELSNSFPRLSMEQRHPISGEDTIIMQNTQLEGIPESSAPDSTTNVMRKIILEEEQQQQNNNDDGNNNNNKLVNDADLTQLGYEPTPPFLKSNSTASSTANSLSVHTQNNMSTTAGIEVVSQPFSSTSSPSQSPLPPPRFGPDGLPLDPGYSPSTQQTPPTIPLAQSTTRARRVPRLPRLDDDDDDDDDNDEDDNSDSDSDNNSDYGMEISRCSSPLSDVPDEHLTLTIDETYEILTQSRKSQQQQQQQQQQHQQQQQSKRAVKRTSTVLVSSPEIATSSPPTAVNTRYRDEATQQTLGVASEAHSSAVTGTKRARYATGVISTPAAPAAPASVCETPLPDLETQLTLEAAIDTSIPSSPPASRRRQQQRVRGGQQPPLKRSAPIQVATLSDSDGSPSFSDTSATTQIQSIPAINATHTAHPMADAVPDALGLYTPRTLTTATTATAVTSVHATSSVSAPVISTLTGLPPPSASKSVATDAVTGSRRKAGLRGAGARKNQNQTHNQQAIDQLTPFSTATTATLATAIATDRTNRSGGTIVDTSDLMDASLISSFSPDTRQSKPSTSSSRRGKKTLVVDDDDPIEMAVTPSRPLRTRVTPTAKSTAPAAAAAAAVSAPASRRRANTRQARTAVGQLDVQPVRSSRSTSRTRAPVSLFDESTEYQQQQLQQLQQQMTPAHLSRGPSSVLFESPVDPIHSSSSSSSLLYHQPIQPPSTGALRRSNRIRGNKQTTAGLPSLQMMTSTPSSTAAAATAVSLSRPLRYNESPADYTATTTTTTTTSSSTTTPLATTATTTSAVPSLRPIYGLQLTNATQTISSAAVASAVTGSLRAMITGDKKSFYSNKLRQYGVGITEDYSTADVLVVVDLRRTLKLLTAISRGISIVTPAWIDDADSNGGLLSANFDSFMPKGTPMESKYGFVLEMSLRDSREAALDTTGTVRAGRNLLSGYKVYSSSLAQQPAVSRTHSQSSTAALATTTSSAANATAAAAVAAANSGSTTGTNVESSPDNINKICIAAGAEILKTMPSDKTLAASQYNAAQIVVVVPKAEPAASLVRKMKRWKEYGCLVKIDNFVLDGILLQALDTIGKQHDPKYL